MEIMIVVAIIGLLAAIAIPNFVKARTQSQANACVNNLRQIDSAKQQWALEFKKAQSASPSSTDVTPYIGRGANGTYPTCPVAGGTYKPNKMDTVPTCSLVSTLTNHVLTP